MVSGSWWWTGKPGVLQSMGSQRVGHDWVTELNWWCLEAFGSSRRARSPECKAHGHCYAARTLRAIIWALNSCNSCLTSSKGTRAGLSTEHESRSLGPMMCLAKERIQKQHENTCAGVVQTDSSLLRILHWWKCFPTGGRVWKIALAYWSLLLGGNKSAFKTQYHKSFKKWYLRSREIAYEKLMWNQFRHTIYICCVTQNGSLP